ncbi:hypothetical protein QWT87_17620 [Chryseobacterium sp. APV1]|uniref:Uncharacterized protein n=1 Tax=Chryseobacterium urinae TaxID=3058400 RepID=A0ABT8U6K5_9FLAO|nr:hypothetical protein [Chryseobacterium sp. APV1]MDO3426703.1 hypothetical protein [Chryseobacterium sp. APV1]
MDKNIILEKFSSTFFIEGEKMKNYFIINNLENFDEVLTEFEDMRKKAFDIIWEKSEHTKLTSKEVENLSEKYLKENYPWINIKGIKAVNNYLIWLSWHEGII